MAALTARPARSLSIAETNHKGEGSSSSSATANNGILCNAHEAPTKNKTLSNGIGQKLKAAFTHNQPGKQLKPNAVPMGKTFHREQPLPHVHAGGEVLKVDPRGPDANVGDGVVLSQNGVDDDDEEEEEEEGIIGENPGSPDAISSNGTYSESGSNDYLSPPSIHSRRSRSNTGSTEVSESGSSVCKIKFAPLPTSGRLKRANSITIGVAARSQLLQSQGAGRQTGNAAAWQQLLQQQQQQQQNNHPPPQSPHYSQINNSSRYSGIQPIQEHEMPDLGEGIRKGASKAWNRIRRGSSVSSSSSNSNTNPTTNGMQQKSAKNGIVEEAVEDDDDDTFATSKTNGALKGGGGEDTPKRSQSPSHDLDENEPDGARTPRHGVHRRVSTGAFIGHQSLLQIEERRKRGEDENIHQNFQESERENEATRFIEMLGRTGAGNEAFHHADEQNHHVKKSQSQQNDVRERLIKVVKSDKWNPSDKSESGSEFDHSGKSQSEDDDYEEEEEGDDEETLEAERLADQALKGHSEKALKAGAVEKMEKRNPLGFIRK